MKFQCRFLKSKVSNGTFAARFMVARAFRYLNAVDSHLNRILCVDWKGAQGSLEPALLEPALRALLGHLGNHRTSPRDPRVPQLDADPADAEGLPHVRPRQCAWKCSCERCT